MNIPTEDIVQFLDSSLPEERQLALLQWRQDSEENELEFQKFIKTWEASHKALESKEQLVIDIDSALDKVNSTIDSKQAQQQSKVVPFYKRRSILSIAAGLAFLFVALFAMRQFNSDASLAPQSFTTTDIGQYIDLPDKTRIWMEPHTEVAYAKDFNTNRNITMQGEIFIDVLRDVERPFTIASKHLQVEVLGTSFVVSDTEEEDKAHVSVISGKVSVATISNGTKIIIEKGESVSYNKNSMHLSLDDVQTDFNHLYKYTKVLNFNNSTIEDLFKRLEQLSSISIKIETQSLKDCIFTGRFTNKSIREILEALKPIYKFDIYSKNKEYIIRGGTCNK